MTDAASFGLALPDKPANRAAEFGVTLPSAGGASQSEPPSALRSYLSEALGALKDALPEVGRAAKDIVGGALIPTTDPRPGFNRLGDIAQFLSGGLMSPLGVEGQAARSVDAGAKVGEIGEARNLARERKAPAQIEKLQQPAPARETFGRHPADYIGVIEAAHRGDLRWLALTFGRQAAEAIIDWARKPIRQRRVDDLRRFLDARREGRVEDMQRFVDEHGGPGGEKLRRMIEERRRMIEERRPAQ